MSAFPLKTNPWLLDDRSWLMDDHISTLPNHHLILRIALGESKTQMMKKKTFPLKTDP